MGEQWRAERRGLPHRRAGAVRQGGIGRASCSRWSGRLGTFNPPSRQRAGKLESGLDLFAEHAFDLALGGGPAAISRH